MRNDYSKEVFLLKITDIKFKIATFKFVEPFKIAFAVMEGYDTLVVKIETDEGIVGYGEAAPMGFVTGDNLELAMAIGKEYREMLIGKNPLAIGHIHAVMDSKYLHNTSIKAAIDIACYDIAAKKMGVPLYQFLGGDYPVVESDVTIGIGTPEHMAKKSKEWVEKGFNILKIKLGEDIETDLKRMKLIREAVGNDVTLRIDANQGWSVKDAIRISKELENIGVDLIEQPIVHWDLEGLAEIKRAVNIPIAADESCQLPVDASKLARLRAVDGMNIKLMKCGGIYNAIKINAIAEAANIFCMIGCMGESVIANAAGMHVAAALANIKKVDLDVTFYTKSDWILGGFTREGGVCTLLDQPGIGVSVEGF